MTPRFQNLLEYARKVASVQSSINFYKERINKILLERQRGISGSGLKSLSIEQAIIRLENLDERLQKTLKEAESGDFETYDKIATWVESNQRQLESLKRSQRKRVNIYEFSYELIDAIKDRVKIVDMLDELNIKKKRSGGNRYVVICPFHDEDTPSCMIYAQEDKFHCFGCEASGDVIDFYQKYLDLEFDEALTRLCDRLSIQVMDADQVEKADKMLEAYRDKLREAEEILNRVKYNKVKEIKCGSL